MKNNNLVEWVLRNEQGIRRAVYESRNDAGDISTRAGQKSCSKGDPVAARAIRNVTELPNVLVEYGNGRTFNLRTPEKWLRLVDIVKEHYENGLQGLMIAKIYQESQSLDETMADLGVSRSTLYVMRLDVMTFAEGVAYGLGLIQKKFTKC